MSKLPRCSPECSTTRSWRKPVGGCGEGEAQQEAQHPGPVSRVVHRGEHAEGVFGPTTVRPSSENRDAIRACSWVGSSSQLCDRFAPGRGRTGQGGARCRYSVGSDLRPAARAGRRPVRRCRAVLRGGGASVVIPDHPESTSEDGRASRRREAAQRQPGERGRRRPGRLRRRARSAAGSARRRPRSGSPAMCSGAVRAWCSATTVGRRSRAACNELVGSSPRGRSPRAGETSVRVSAATRSGSSTTPSTSPVAESTGKWRTPRSSMSSHTSLPSRSAATV